MTQQNAYGAQNIQKITLTHLQQLKSNNQKISALTAYDASMAKIIDECAIEIILVGDSLAMTIQGHTTTLPVTIADICYHTQNVARGAKKALIMADMPFGSYDTPENTFKNAVRIMQTGANIVKIEANHDISSTVQKLSQNGIPVCAHFGLTPQFINQLGTYKVQGKQEKQANQIIHNAKAAQTAGAQLILLECVPTALAAAITSQLNIPVIGIGAGNATDGQILVIQDMLGMTPSPAKFTKNFLAETNSIQTAIMLFKQAVKSNEFPSIQHSYIVNKSSKSPI